VKEGIKCRKETKEERDMKGKREEGRKEGGN
jgi:hypothetical protein